MGICGCKNNEDRVDYYSYSATILFLLELKIFPFKTIEFLKK